VVSKAETCFASSSAVLTLVVVTVSCAVSLISRKVSRTLAARRDE